MAPRVSEHLFLRIQKEKEERRGKILSFTRRCSFLEICNGQILDLLNPNPTNLQDNRHSFHPSCTSWRMEAPYFMSRTNRYSACWSVPVASCSS
uniref:Kinesin motor domain-containing protein n=2 Tax=Triticum urartu TaxID=4572 RepID=A0A8R7PY26_TRIUA